MKRQANSSFRHYRRSSPESVTSLLGPSFRKLRIAGKIEQYSVFAHWPEIVGAEVAKVAKPEKIVRGRILVVRVLDAAWAQELTMSKTEILQKFREIPNGPTFEDVRFIVSGPKDVHERKALNRK